jgi:histidinol dehydrogenase
VEKIVNDIQEKGDVALLEYTAALDGCALTKDSLRVTPEEIKAAYAAVSPEFLTALRQAAENIRQFHMLQKRRDWFTQDDTGSVTGQIFRPLSRVGAYVPGGTANYPSSVLMTCLPAAVAGVPEIVVVTPPDQSGGLPAATLVAAAEADVQEIYKIGGAQAIAALAYGTETIRSVDKIVGPGNIYVTLAKKLIYGAAGIDMLAGPSEVLVIGDGSVSAGLAAADLLTQAEHDKRARAILITPDREWAARVVGAVNEQLQELPRQSIAGESLSQSGAVIVVKDLEEAFAVSNQVAPEHLSLLVAEPWTHLAKVQNAGSIFMGSYTPESLGDYWAGPNHVLPTGGAARYASPLSVDDFCKKSSITNYTKEGLLKARAGILTLARTEKLWGHGLAVEKRFLAE